MPSKFQTLNSEDIAVTKTLLHESIPLTGTIVSGTYNEANIKDFSHGMFQAVYDYPYLSSSANHIFDISVGYHSSSPLSGAASIQNAKKINIYNQFAQLLAGYDPTGSVRLFDKDGDLSSGTKHKSMVFLSFSRLLAKDEIKKGSFTMKIGTGSYGPSKANFRKPASGAPANGPAIVTIKDVDAQNKYKINSPAGEYGLLMAQSSSVYNTNKAVGLIFYQAGVVALTSSVFVKSGSADNTGFFTSKTYAQYVKENSISGACNVIRSRIQDITFNNTTELNSKIYFCRAKHNQFNFSTNKTYTNPTNGKLRVKEEESDSPVAYITTIGLYNQAGELLAVAKLSEPLKKDPTNELNLRVRLDY